MSLVSQTNSASALSESFTQLSIYIRQCLLLHTMLFPICFSLLFLLLLGYSTTHLSSVRNGGNLNQHYTRRLICPNALSDSFTCLILVSLSN